MPLHESPPLWVVSQASPHPLQFAVVFVGVSQPFVSGAAVLQLAKPWCRIPCRGIVDPLQVSPLLCVVSHAAPHALQLDVVFVWVSQPSESGGVLALQSP